MPPDLAQCVFVIEQALSVRALQELITSGADDAVGYKYVYVFEILIVILY